MKPITFCIPTAKNEKEYIKLLLDSLIENTEFNIHEVLIFIDSDNQATYEELLTYKVLYPNIKIYRNTSKFQIGGQRNVSIMFDNALNETICYIQSDMVVGVNFDKFILEGLDENNVVLSLLRIEPPLHPESPEKIVKDFGSEPSDFKYKEFKEYSEKIQKENREYTLGYFAPFATTKETWCKLGGWDTQFRCSREDSDFIIRMAMHSIKSIQSWRACVYHFTCVSSRGIGWFKNDEEAAYKNDIQKLADAQELKRFIRKWGYFGHSMNPVYDTSIYIELDRYVDFNILLWIEPYFKKIYLNDQYVVKHFIERVEFAYEYYSNLRWNYSQTHWNEVKHLFNPTDFSTHIMHSNSIPTNEIVVSCKYSELVSNINEDTKSIIENFNAIINENDTGKFEVGPFTITINSKTDISTTYKTVENFSTLINSQKFIFE